MIYLELFLSFFQIGLFSIGGGYAAMPLIQQQVVDAHAWLTMTQFADVMTIAEMTPGPIAINSATFVGIQIAGIPGAIIATLGCICPSCVIVMLLAYLYYRFRGLNMVQGILAGLRPAVVAMIASAGLSLIVLSFYGQRSMPADWSGIRYGSVIIFGIGLFVLRKWKINPVYVMGGAGVMGVILTMTGCGLIATQPDSSAVLSEERKQDGNRLMMTFLDTGKSDCIVIELEDCVIVNDTADADDYELISGFLDEKQITTIDYMILSHFDKDHIGSAAMLLTNYDVDCVIMPDYEETSLYYEALVQALEQSDAQQLWLYDDYSFTASGAEIVVSAANETEYKDDNNYSLITTVTYGENRFLLMGDAMKKRTGEFLETVLAEEHYDLIKMPHHGDYYKKLEDLIACVRPDAAVLTVGQERDRLEEETVLLLQEYGCRIYDTIDGNVNVESDGGNISVTQG